MSLSEWTLLPPQHNFCHPTNTESGQHSLHNNFKSTREMLTSFTIVCNGTSLESP